MELPSTIALRREPGSVARSLVALLLRVGLGMLFLMAGIMKFRAMKGGTYPAMIVDQFAGSGLHPYLVKLFAKVLPYAEVALGVGLIAGLFTMLTAAMAGALLLNLLFGRLTLNDAAAGPDMMIYLLVDAGILWLSPVASNYLSVDGLIFGWLRSPRAEGHYTLEGEPAPRQARSPIGGRDRPDFIG